MAPPIVAIELKGEPSCTMVKVVLCEKDVELQPVASGIALSALNPDTDGDGKVRARRSRC